MERRYEELLTARLEDAALHGCSHITLNELRSWYGVGKLAARTWRDLCERWQEVTNRKEGQLMGVSGRDGWFIFGQKNAKPLDPDR